jgi:tetratricopeptide (TPR) repeat protein
MTRVTRLMVCAALLAGGAGTLAPAARAATLAAGQRYVGVQQAFLREDFDVVVSLAQSFLLEHPQAPEVPRVWLWLALSLDKMERPAEALQELTNLKNRLPAGDPLWAEVLFWEGDVSRRAYQVPRARAAYQQLLDRYKDSTWALQARLGIGLVDLHQERFDQAIKHFREVVRQQPDSPAATDARLFEGLCQLRLKKYDEAARLLEPMLGHLTEPATVAQAAFYLGESLTGLERYEDAAAAYERAVDAPVATRWTGPALFGLGWSQFRAGRCGESADSFARYLSEGAAEHRTEAMFARASCLLKLDREREALALFERILSAGGQHTLAVESGLIVVDAYRRQGRTVLAKELLGSLLRRPMDAVARGHIQLRLGSIALEEGNAAKAQALYKTAAEVSDPSIKQAALSGLADVSMYLGDQAEARTLYERTAKMDPNSSQASYAAYQLGRMAMQHSQYADAIASFRQLAAGAGSLAEDAKLALALAYLNSNQPQQARELLQEIRRTQARTPLAARAGYYLALVELDARNDDAAERLCEETIARAGHTEEALDARLLLVELMTQRDGAPAAMRRLRGMYAGAGLPRRHRGRLAKRLGDLARSEGAYRDAYIWYDEAANLLPALRNEAVYRIASCYEEGGDLEMAMQWYQQIDEAPWRVRGQMALAKLYERQDRPAEAGKIYRALVKEGVPEAKVAEERLADLR